MKHKRLLFIFLAINPITTGITRACSQQTKTLTELIQQAQLKSVQFRQFKLKKEAARIGYSIFEQQKKPLLSLTSNIIDFNNDNFQVVQPDGSIKYQKRRQNESFIGLAFSQPIPFTNGSFSVNTELYRVDNFLNKSTQYNGIPVYIKYTQPLFTINQFRWNKEIELMKLTEADLSFNLEINGLAYDICKRFFDVIEAQNDKLLAKINLEINSANYKIEKRKVDAGQSTEDKLIQLNMQDLTFKQSVVISDSRIKKALMDLEFYIPDLDVNDIDLSLPEQVPAINFNSQEIMTKVKQSSILYQANSRKLKEAKLNVAKTKAASYQVNLVVNYGLSKTGDQVDAIYQNPNDQQRVSVGLTVPIYDWGKRKKNMDLAVNFEKQVELENINEENLFNNHINEILNTIPILHQNIGLASELNALAKKRYTIAERLYSAGKITLFDLQTSEFAKETAGKSYINAVRSFWETYYQFKSLTGISLDN